MMRKFLLEVTYLTTSDPTLKTTWGRAGAAFVMGAEVTNGAFFLYCFSTHLFPLTHSVEPAAAAKSLQFSF